MTSKRPDSAPPHSLKGVSTKAPHGQRTQPPLMATFCFACFSDVCTCGIDTPQQALAGVWFPDATFDHLLPAENQQTEDRTTPTSPSATRLTPTREIGQTDEDFANACFPQPHQHGSRAKLLSLLQQPWLLFNQPEPTGAFTFLLTNSTNGRQECSICSKPCRRGGRALEHIRAHLGHKPFSCYGGDQGCSRFTCGKLFHSKEALKDHQRRTNSQCIICDRVVLSKNYLRHVRIHLAGK